MADNMPEAYGSGSNLSDPGTGQEAYEMLKELFPLARSLTGNGVRETLRIISRHIPLEIQEVPTGTRVFDWTVPKEWNIRDAFVLDEHGSKVLDFGENNLHVVGYSTPVDKVVSLAELEEHLHSLEEQPKAIPYVTSYYEERWGFCMAHEDRVRLIPGQYRVYIDSELTDGFLTYAEYLIPGQTEKEVFISTYICHPSMANNELSGPVLATFLAKWIASIPRRYSYRVVFLPETIGSITYLSKNLHSMQENIVAGFNLSCIGDDRVYSYLPSRNGNTLADRVALTVLRNRHPGFISYRYLDRGSDERQYCSPGVDLPVASLMRSKYGAYPEYHTSLDNLDLVTPDGLQGSFQLLQDCVELIERNRVYQVTCYGEPQLGKRGLYPTLSKKVPHREVIALRTMMNLIAYADGSNDLIDISDTIQVAPWDLYPIVDRLIDSNLLTEREDDP